MFGYIIYAFSSKRAVRSFLVVFLPESVKRGNAPPSLRLRVQRLAVNGKPAFPEQRDEALPNAYGVFCHPHNLMRLLINPEFFSIFLSWIPFHLKMYFFI
jgi:hypothetical protein